MNEKEFEELVERVLQRVLGSERISYSIPEAARVAGASEWRIRNAIKRGDLSATKCQPYLVSKESLNKWVGNSGQT